MWFQKPYCYTLRYNKLNHIKLRFILYDRLKTGIDSASDNIDMGVTENG